ncbi:MAG: DUF3631 domain-containing protein [Betaproteobacteria bacterium]|nr:DUF3631 domain-containing protein [Betaproteobacteria bacterium]
MGELSNGAQRGAAYLDEQIAKQGQTPEQMVSKLLSQQDADTRRDDEASIARLAGLTPVEYERIRTEEAKRLGVRTAVLDRLVQVERQQCQTVDGISFEDVTPWPDAVSGDALLSDIACTIGRFIVCKIETAQAAALWIAMTWFIDMIEVAPLAVITAPEKRCGKSQLLTLLGKLSHRPMVVSNISPSALFRVIDTYHPTLMIDEADAFMRDNEELRGILNSGHTRDSAYVVRVVGENLTPKQFSTWRAKAIAGIGKLADTLMDRAITLDLRRKMPHEEVERIRHARPELFDDLASRLCRFATDQREAVRRARPSVPGALNDRAQDNWEPLLAIAEVAGGIWPETARQVAIAISGGMEESAALGTELLASIRDVFEAKRETRIYTKDLIEALCEDEEKPWASYSKAGRITPRQLAKRLKDYGVASQLLRIGSDVLRGYERVQFEDAFCRYLPASVSATGAGVTVTESAICYKKPSNDAGCNVVTDKTGNPIGGEEQWTF